MNANKTIVHDLQLLLSICIDGRDGYKNAANSVQASELRALFTTYSVQRSEFAMKLNTAIRTAGGIPDDTPSAKGSLHRAWLNIQAALSTNDNKAVLAACITGERAAVEAYNAIMNRHKNFTMELRQLIMQQRSQISEALHHMIVLEHQMAS